MRKKERERENQWKEWERERNSEKEINKERDRGEREREREREREKERGREILKIELRKWAGRNNLITDKLIPLNSAELVYTVSCACLFLLTK